MTLEEQLSYCRVCKNRSFSRTQGIVCGLTADKPNFVNSCLSFENDPLAVKQEEKIQAKTNHLTKNVNSQKKVLWLGGGFIIAGLLCGKIMEFGLNTKFVAFLGFCLLLVGIILMAVSGLMYLSQKQAPKQIRKPVQTINKNPKNKDDDFEII